MHQSDQTLQAVTHEHKNISLHLSLYQPPNTSTHALTRSIGYPKIVLPALIFCRLATAFDSHLALGTEKLGEVIDFHIAKNVNRKKKEKKK